MDYIKEIVKQNKGLIFIYLVIGILNAFLANYKADYFQRIVDGMASGSLVLGSILFYGAILITNYCMNYLDEYPAKKLEHGLFLDFKLLALRKISTIDYQAYQKLGTGALVQRIENGAEAGRNVLCSFWFCLIRELVPTICFSIYFIWRINRNVTYFLLIGYVVIIVITHILLKALYRMKEKILDHEEQLNHFLVRGFMELLVFRMERQFPNEIDKATNAKKTIVSSKVKMNMVHEAFFTIFALLVALLDIGILVYAWKSCSISVGSVVALISLVENAYTPIAIFNVLYVQYKLDKASFARLKDFLELEDDRQLEQGYRGFQLQGEIRIQNLDFQYEQRQIFRQLCLSIDQGEKIAFVGESGCGKSTLTKLMVGLLKYETGNILYDDMELKDICLNELYGQIQYLSQEAPVFDGTIRENLVFGEAVPDERIFQALQSVQLSSLPENCPNGLDTEIGERGTILSGGEKQRLAMARLLFQKPKMVILDEATSAMDNLTEEAVMNEILRALQGSTVIAVAHRLHAIADFDRIVVFRQGQIVGQGTFQELMQENEYFTELYQSCIE